MTTRLSSFLVFLVAALCAAPDAFAQSDPAIRVDGEMGYACALDGETRLHGSYLSGDVGYVVDPFWVLRTGYVFGRHQSKDREFTTHQVNLGLKYQLDVFAYVPWVELAPTVYFTNGQGGPESPDFGISAGLGFDWLMNPEWSTGVAIRYHDLASQGGFPAYVMVGFRIGRRWTLGDPFDP